MIARTDSSYDPAIPERLIDLYLPDAPAERILVWFHGGGLTSGTRHIDPAWARFVTDRRCAIASVEYRLAPKARHPDWLADAAAAVRWTRDEIAAAGAADVPLFLAGHSAGAWVALMTGMDARWLAAEGIALVDIAGIIPISGQATTHHCIREHQGLAREVYSVDHAAPIFHARADVPPILAFSGGEDMALRSAENRFLMEVLTANGHADHAFHEIPGRDHVGVAAGLAQAGDPLTLRMWAFIDRVCAAKTALRAS